MSENNGRPNTPINVLVGSSIIKEKLDYSDDDIVEGLMLDIRLQYALHTTSFQEQPLSDKSLRNFRRRCYQYELETGNDLMHTCIADLIIRLKKESVEGIPESLLHYAEENDFNQVFYYAKNSDYSEKCMQLLADADKLLAFCDGRFVDWKEYKLFNRCLSEQTVKKKGKRRLATQENGTMDASILQNPSDPDATFRRKAGKEHRGYVANLEESVGENGSVITDYQFEQNTYSDSQFLADALTAMEPAEELVTIVTDGAYPTPANQKLAEEKNVRIVSTKYAGEKGE